MCAAEVSAVTPNSTPTQTYLLKSDVHIHLQLSEALGDPQETQNEHPRLIVLTTSPVISYLKLSTWLAICPLS